MTEPGESIDNDFHIGQSGQLVLTPELATLLLFGLGAAILRKNTKILFERAENKNSCEF